MATPKIIDQVFAWISVSPEGDEGVLMVDLDGTRYPLMAYDRQTIEQSRHIAKAAMAEQPDWHVLLIQLGTRTVLDDLRQAGSA